MPKRKKRKKRITTYSMGFSCGNCKKKWTLKILLGDRVQGEFGRYTHGVKPVICPKCKSNKDTEVRR